MDIMSYYLWIVTFHIMAVMSWMAMLFYQPRLFVYHTENKNKKDFVDVVKVQEYKMYHYIGVPAMWATIISGAFMIYLRPEMFSEGGWLHAKLLFVFILIIYSYSLEHFRKRLEQEIYPKKENFFRAYNEVPTILALLIVTYVITKTFSILFTLITLVLGAFIVYKVLKQTPKGNK